MTAQPPSMITLETIWDLVDWIGTERFHLKDGAKHALAEHRDIFECLKAGDTAEAMDEFRTTRPAPRVSTLK